MQYHKLGKSDLQVSVIGLGCMSLPVDDFAQSARLIHSAFDFGLNYFDTADLYDRGANEEILGKAIRDFRQEVIVATKVGNAWKDGVEGWTWNPTKEHIVHSVEQSLRRLRTDYIDLYQLHGGTVEDSFEEVIETFEVLQQEGKIRQYGLSSIRPNVFTKYLAGSALASNMMQYSALDTRSEEYLEQFVQAEVSLIARGSLAQGILLDKPVEKPYLQHSIEGTDKIKQTVADTARDLGVSKQTVAMKYVLDKPAVATTIVGVRTNKQLEELQQTAQELENIASIDLEGLLKGMPKIYYQDHRS